MPFRARAHPSSIPLHRNVAHRLRRPASSFGLKPNPNPSFPSSSTKPESFFQSKLIEPPTSIETRPRSSSSPSPSLFSKIFGLRKSGESSVSNRSNSVQEDFFAAIESRNVLVVKKTYDTIISTIHHDSSSSSSTSVQRYISSEDVLAAMEMLSRSNSANALPLLYRMYTDAGRLGYENGAKHHHEMIRGFCHGGMIHQAFKLARSRENTEVNWRWGTILAGAVNYEPSLVDEVVEHIQQERKLTDFEYAILVEHLRLRLARGDIARDEGREEFKHLLSKMLGESGSRMKMKRSGETSILRVLVALGEVERAEVKAASWEGEEVTKEMWVALLELRMVKDDRDGVVELCRMDQVESRAVERASAWLAQRRLAQLSEIRAEDVVGAVEAAENETGIDATVEVYTILMQDLMKRSEDDSGLDMALAVYGAARDRGVTIDLTLAHLLITALCSTEPSRLDQALDLYSDLISAEAFPTDLISRRKLSEAYRILLVACSRSQDRLSFQDAIRLLGDMKARGVFLHRSSLARLVVDLMHSAPDHSSAFRVYSLAYSLNHSALPETAFYYVATTFLQLSWDESPFVPLNLFLEMVKDMHRAGLRPDSRIYTALLHQYGIQARTMRYLLSTPDALERKGTVRQGLFRAIQDLHTRIKLDPMIEVDIPLLNALMNAYNRIGSWYQASKVWEELLDRFPSEDPSTVKDTFGRSISIILDACGYAGMCERARKIWAWARRHDFLDNPKLWDTYVECLCRCGKFDEALELVCGGVHGTVFPGKESCRILLKFSWRDERWFRTVQGRVRETFPEWWDELREIVEKGEGDREGMEAN